MQQNDAFVSANCYFFQVMQGSIKTIVAFVCFIFLKIIVAIEIVTEDDR